MQVIGIVWLGTRTAKFDEMAEFAENVLGLKPTRRDDGFVMYRLPRGDLFEVFGPDTPGGGHQDGVAGGLLVDDVQTAVAELRAAGVEVTHVESAGPYHWAYFRAPDGNLYELTSGPYERA